MDTVQALTARLRSNPADSEAFQHLKALYRQGSDFASLANLIAGWAGWVSDDRAAASAYVEVGDLLASEMQDTAQAETFYQEALRRDPANLAACDALHGIWEARGEFGRLAELLQEQIELHAQQATAPKQLAVLRYRLGELYAKHLQRPDEALQEYREALELDPALLRAMYEARQLCLAQGDLRGAAQLYESEATVEPNAERRASLLAELASLYRNDLGDVDSAISALDRAHSLAPDDTAVSYELATALLQRSEQADERTARVDHARVADLLCKIAGAVEPEQAIGYLETALGYVPSHERSLSALESLLERGPQMLRLAPHWVAYLASAPASREAYGRRVKLARAYVTQGQLEDAIFCLEPAAQGGHGGARELLAELRAKSGKRGSSGPPPPPPLPASRRSTARAMPAAKLEAERNSAQPQPRSEPPPRDAHIRDTTDMGEVNTQVAAADLVDSLREAAAEESRGAHARASEQPPRAFSAFEPQPTQQLSTSDIETVVEPPISESVGTALPLRGRELSPEELLELRRMAADLAREHRQSEASAAYEEILAADPLDREAFAFLDGYYRRKQQHELRAQLLERSAAAEGLPTRVRVTRLREAAGTYETRLKDYDAAIRTLHVLSRIAPEEEDAHRALKRLLERAGRWDELAQVLEAELERTADGEHRIPQLRKLAGLHRDRRGDLDAAADVLKRLLALTPDDRATRESYADTLLALQRFDELLPLLERKVDETTSKAQKLALLRQIATLCRDQIKDVDRAFEIYARMLELAPADSQTLAELSEMEQAAGNHERLLATYEKQVGRTRDAQAAALLATMAEIAETGLQDRDRACDLLSRAVDLAPDQPEHLHALATLYERAERYDDLVELLRERCVVERNAQARVELYRRIAKVLGAQLADEDGARDAWQQLLQIKEDREALHALQQDAIRRDDTETLVKLLERTAALVTDATERRDLVYERAELLAQRLQRPQEAIAGLARILLEIDPDFEPAFDALGEASEAASDYRALAQVMEQRLLRVQEPDARADQARALADLYEEKLIDGERAVRALDTWAAADPHDVDPHRRLCPLLARARRYEQLVAALDALTRLESEPEARARAAIQAAEVLHLRRKDVEGAWQRLLPWVEQRLPAAVEAVIALGQSSGKLDALYDLLERTEQQRKLLALLRERASRDKDRGTRATLLRRIAQLLIDYEADEQGAAEAYRRLLEIEEDADALRFLQVRAIRDDDIEALVDILKRLAAIEPDAAESRDLAFERARLLYTRLARSPEAVVALEEILKADPNHEPALDELVRASEAARDFKTLASALERSLARTHDADTRIALARRLADVCLDELEDQPRAAKALDAWATADPEDPEPHRRLLPLLQDKGSEAALLASLDALARTEDTREARIEATLSAATLARNRLKDVSGAWDRLAPLLPEAEARVDQALYALAVDAGRHDELYALLERCERYDTLVEWLNQRIAVEQTDTVKVELYRRTAHLYAGPLRDEDAALQTWSRLLRVREDGEALAFLRGQALQRDDMVLLCDCLRRLAALESDASERRDLLYEYGHLLHARLARHPEAAAVLREICEQLDPDFEPALDELVEACEASGDTAGLCWALERVLGREQPSEERAALAERLYHLYRDKLGDAAQATAALQIWIRAAPIDPAPHHLLAGMLRGKQRPAELLAQLDEIVAKDGGARQQVARLEAAQVALDELRDGERAWHYALPLCNTGNDAAESLLSRVAFEHGKLEELSALYQAAERYDDLISLLRAQAERSKEPNLLAELYRRCAKLLAGPLGDEIAAAEAFREVLRHAEDVDALEFLRAQAERVDDPAELSDLLERLAKLKSDPREKRDLLFERAQLLCDKLDRPEQAVAALRAILSELDPAHVPAIEELITLSEASDDYASLAVALEHKLRLAQTAGERSDIAENLATIYEDKLEDSERAAHALLAWADAAPGRVEPRRRLRSRLEQSGDAQALLATLDALAQHETSPEARAEAALAAADLTAHKLGDTNGAWERISPFFLAGDERAQQAARALADSTKQYRPLVHLYVLRAQQATKPSSSLHDWREAARLYEQRLSEPSEALEAALRALALDMSNRELLDEIERFAVAAKAWDRLWRVFNRLIQDARDDSTRIELVLRSADLWSKHGQDDLKVLERLLAACKLAPQRDDVLERAATIAQKTGNHAELVWLREGLARNAKGYAERARQLLHAARAADVGLGDREYAFRDIAQALASCEHAPEVAGEIEDLVRDLDRARPELGKFDARQTLIRLHMQLAEQVGDGFGPVLVLRASQLLRDELGDESACFDVLRQGATLFPDDLDVYDALERAAVKLKRLDALDAHLSRSVQRATDDDVKRALLERRGKLNAEHLKRPAKAAEAYRELLDLGDATAFDALLRSLRAAGRYQDLLKLYNERLAKTEELGPRIELMRQMALLWEIELKNRPSAVELWRVVQALAPDDQEANAALSRLGAA
jgi:tetratricopeptide (TPR) repeat protein